MPNNRWVVERQLSSLEKRLEKDSNLKQLFQKTIDDHLARGYIVQVPPNDTTVKKWYLPHHPVTNIHKPGKLRRVTNASSVFRGKSLNSILLTGPGFLCTLTGLILRFRLHRIAISTNIEPMFMQVLVNPKDRPFLRFLRRNNKTMFDYENIRHIFGPTDSPVDCYAVQGCAYDNADDHPDIPAIVQRNIHMDNLHLSLPTDEEATDKAQILRTVLSTGGFNLTKWKSSSRIFSKGSSSELRAAGANLDNSLTPQRFLGMPWDPEKDVYFIPPDSDQNVKDIQTPTQRSLLHRYSMLWDSQHH